MEEKLCLPKQEIAQCCKMCGQKTTRKHLEENLMVCPYCGNPFNISARRRIENLVDENSFCEMFCDMESKATDFPEYEDKLIIARERSGEKEAVICGECSIKGERCVVFVMEYSFMSGSMGRVVGEKITLCFETAIKKKLPIVGVSASSGIRVQEGLASLMQMAKIMGALHQHSKEGNLFISLLTSPTMGGVMASFAMHGDVILAEPNAIVGFAGKRIIERVEKRRLSNEFQTAEKMLENGYIDLIVTREKQRDFIADLLKFYKGK